MTERFDPTALSNAFGPFCVEISQPNDFFELLTRKLVRELRVANLGYFGRAIYVERDYKGLEPHPGPIGFVKPPDKYKEQAEVRMLWETNDSALSPMLIDVPAVAPYIRRVA